MNALITILITFSVNLFNTIPLTTDLDFCTYFLRSLQLDYLSPVLVIIFLFFVCLGWGSTRFDAPARPLSLQHDSSTSISRMSAESSSESEAQSTISGNSVKSGSSKDKDKDKKSGMFRLFSKKKRSSQESK